MTEEDKKAARETAAKIVGLFSKYCAENGSAGKCEGCPLSAEDDCLGQFVRMNCEPVEIVSYTRLANELFEVGRAVAPDIHIGLSDHSESEFITSYKGPDGRGAFTPEEAERLTQVVKCVVGRYGMEIAKSGADCDGAPWWKTDRTRCERAGG